MKDYQIKIKNQLEGDEELLNLLGSEDKIYPIQADNPTTPYLVHHSKFFAQTATLFSAVDDVKTIVEVVSASFIEVLELADRVRAILESQSNISFESAIPGRTIEGANYVITISFTTTYNFIP